MRISACVSTAVPQSAERSRGVRVFFSSGISIADSFGCSALTSTPRRDQRFFDGFPDVPNGPILRRRRRTSHFGAEPQLRVSSLTQLLP
jgi:hypothetical protein